MIDEVKVLKVLVNRLSTLEIKSSLSTFERADLLEDIHDIFGLEIIEGEDDAIEMILAEDGFEKEEDEVDFGIENEFASPNNPF